MAELDATTARIDGVTLKISRWASEAAVIQAEKLNSSFSSPRSTGRKAALTPVCLRIIQSLRTMAARPAAALAATRA